MVEPAGPWSADETEQFLGSEAIPLRLACHTPAGTLWMLSLWYRFRDGAFHCATSANADVVRFLREDPAVAFEVSTNRPPYRGVRGRGTAHLEPDREKELLADLVDRYLGGDGGDLGAWLLSPDRDEIAVRIDPARLVTWDFTERMSDPDSRE